MGGGLRLEEFIDEKWDWISSHRISRARGKRRRK